MNQSLIVNPALDKARRDLEDATSSLATYWTITDDRDALGRVANAAEALVRAISASGWRSSGWPSCPRARDRTDGQPR
jgi:hypothetical protein